jgi:hypothetical protein
MKRVSTTTRLLLVVVGIIGFAAVALAIAGVVTKNWVHVEGSTEHLNQTIYTKVLPGLTGFITQNLTSSFPASLFINGAVKFAFDSVVANIGSNLKSTTYNLFDKSTDTTKLTGLTLPQGLIIGGLCCVIIGIILALIVGMFGIWRGISIIPLLLLIVGPIAITIGFLLYAKTVVEDFGHDLGITVHLGYSLIAVVLSSIVGFITAILFALTIFHQSGQETIQDEALRSFPSGRKKLKSGTIEMSFENRTWQS